MQGALPFKSKPKQETKLVGTADTGVLEFPVYHSLLWHERQALREADGDYNMFKETALLAGAIAASEGRSDVLDLQQAVIAILSNAMGVAMPMDDATKALRIKYIGELKELTDKTVAWNDRRTLAGVTAFIQNRLDGFVDWDESIVQRHVTQDLMVQIYNFVTEEEAGQSNAQDDERAEVDEAAELGKSSTEPGDLPQSPTGEASTGDSDSSTPVATSSDQSASEASPSPASSEPSKPEKSKSA